MSGRIDPFQNLAEPPAFTTKPKKDKPVEEELVTRISEQNNFPSRQAPKPAKAERRKPRIHRTGRNIQFNAKVTAATNAKIYKFADERSVTLGKLLELALDALEREGAKKHAGEN
jgi:hypothetical protein